VSRDRLAATVLFLTAAAVMFVTAAASEPPSRQRHVEHDEQALVELTRLLDSGERSSWIVEYDYRRTLVGGRTSTARVSHARGERVRITRDATSADVMLGSTGYRCTIVDAEVQCLAVPGRERPALSTADVVRTVVDLRTYAVARLPDETLAGERARCFRVVAVRGLLPALGGESAYCFADDGVPLRRRVSGPVRIDEWVAVRVERDPRRERYEALLRDLALSAETPAGEARE